jgi:YVTN family beta-propeller protein
VTSLQVGPFTSDFRGFAAGTGSVWVPNADNTVSRIDPATNSVIRTIPLDGFTAALATGEGSVWVPDFDLELLYRIAPHAH